MDFDYDIIIIGAGPAGISAAGTLKKKGLRCALIEKTSQVGGTYYASMTNLLKPGPGSMLFNEIKGDISNIQGFELIDPTTLNDRYYGYIEDQGVDLFLENNVYSAQVVMGSILSVNVSGPEGNRNISAKVFIDASGGSFLRTLKSKRPENASKSITVLAGGMGHHDDLKEQIGRLAEHINSQFDGIKVGISPTINRGLYHIRITGNGEDIRKALPDIMKQIEGFEGGSKDVFLIHGAGELYSEDIFTQEARCVLEQNDIAAGRKFEDTVIEGPCCDGTFSIPYRCLLPKGINNMLLCGRSIGSTPEVSDTLDTLKAAYATGQAAALAAEYCIRNNLPLEQADIEQIMNPMEDILKDYYQEEDAEIYIENIDVDDLVEVAPEEDELVALDRLEIEQQSLVEDDDIDESPINDEPVEVESEIEDFTMEDAEEPGVAGQEQAPDIADAYEQAAQPETEDKPFFTEEKIMGAINDPIYDLISEDVPAGVNTAEYEKASGQDDEEMSQEPNQSQEAGVSETADAEKADEMVIEQIDEDQTVQPHEVQAEEESTLEFPQEDIIDKLPSYVLFDEENNALDFSKVKDEPEPKEDKREFDSNAAENLLSLLDVLPDQLPEGLYDFLKEHSRSGKRDDTTE